MGPTPGSRDAQVLNLQNQQLDDEWKKWKEDCDKKRAAWRKKNPDPRLVEKKKKAAAVKKNKLSAAAAAANASGPEMGTKPGGSMTVPSRPSTSSASPTPPAALASNSAPQSSTSNTIQASSSNSNLYSNSNPTPSRVTPSSSTPSSSAQSNPNSIDPILIQRVNNHALTNPHLQSLLSVAASGSAIGDQLKELGGYIGRFTEEIKKEQKAKEEAEKKAKEKEGRIRSLQMGAPEIGNRNESGSPEQVQIPIHPSSSVPAVPTNFQVPPPPSTETQTPEYVEKSPQILANEAKVWEAARMEMERSLPKAPTTSSLQDGSYPRSSPGISPQPQIKAPDPAQPQTQLQRSWSGTFNPLDLAPVSQQPDTQLNRTNSNPTLMDQAPIPNTISPSSLLVDSSLQSNSTQNSTPNPSIPKTSPPINSMPPPSASASTSKPAPIKPSTPSITSSQQAVAWPHDFQPSPPLLVLEFRESPTIRFWLPLWDAVIERRAITKKAEKKVVGLGAIAVNNPNKKEKIPSSKELKKREIRITCSLPSIGSEAASASSPDFPSSHSIEKDQKHSRYPATYTLRGEDAEETDGVTESIWEVFGRGKVVKTLIGTNLESDKLNGRIENENQISLALQNGGDQDWKVWQHGDTESLDKEKRAAEEKERREEEWRIGKKFAEIVSQ